MIKLYWTDLNGQDQVAYRAVTAFLDGRLQDCATIDWALRLKRRDTIKRLALLDLLDSTYGREIAEPWRSAWRFIEESWDRPLSEDQSSVGRVQVQFRIQTGEKSGALVAAIVGLVAPRLNVEPFSDLQLHYRKLPKHPRHVSDLFSSGLSSGNVLDPSALGMGSVNDQMFLFTLASALDAAVIAGMGIARQIGWDGKQFWKLGGLNRVYYVPASDRSENENEPDEFHRGIAPSVKLLHAV